VAKTVNRVAKKKCMFLQAGQELISAAFSGDTSKAVQLLAAGADLEERDRVGSEMRF
jgi:hypothetical protein